MVEVGVLFGLGSIVVGLVIIWRVFVIEQALHERVDDIDSSLGGVVGLIIEKIDAIGANVPDINLIQNNPIAQILDFLKGNDPSMKYNTGHPPPKDNKGQFVEVMVEENGTKKKGEGS